MAEDDWFVVPMGQLTFDAEGMESPGSKYHSRHPHVPGATSGITIGRGYDMKLRSADSILLDMTTAGLPAHEAEALAQCAGYSGAAGKAYLQDNNLVDLSISPEAQHRLFLASYEELLSDVRRICSKADVVAKYGATPWEELDPILRDVVIDLRYRGDYKSSTRKDVQPLVVTNNCEALRELMADEQYWMDQCKVPRDRFERRRNYFSKQA